MATKTFTISLMPELADFMEERRKSEEFNNNRSTYVSDLVRRDKKRLERAKATQQAG